MQSKDIAHTQKYVAERFAAKARESEGGPWSRMLARMTLAGLPRGGGNGDDIRMGILNIMRANGIKEGHRPVSDVRLVTPQVLSRVQGPLISMLSFNAV